MATENIEKLEPLAAPEATYSSAVRKRRIIIFVVVTIVNLSLLAVLWSQLMTPHTSTAQDTNGGDTIVGNAPTTLQGKSAPDFMLDTLNGTSKQLGLSSFKGKAVMLNFWSSSCIPCQQEASFLQQTWTNLQAGANANNVVMLGVDSSDPNVQDSLNFIKTYKMTYPNVRDTGTQTGIDYGITGWPETFFINKDGIVVSRWLGPLDDNAMRNQLAKVGIHY